MKRALTILLILSIINTICTPIYARQGDCGYEGGIASGEAAGKTSFDYQEVCILSGEPILFKGTMVLKKALKQDAITSTYTYTLKNVDKSATLSRKFTYTTKLSKKENGQTVEETVLGTKPTEVVKIGDTSYTLTSIDFTRTSLVDKKPAINYYSGNLWWKKTFVVGDATDGSTIVTETTGNFYGYDQYWGVTEVGVYNSTIQAEIKKDTVVDKWGGNIGIKLSSTVSKEFGYFSNEPEQISFDGGFVQTQNNTSVMEYTSSLPEFDKNGISTDRILEASDSTKIETFPSQTRLLVPNLSHLRGHWAENDIKRLYSLEIFKGNDAIFEPEQYINRAEFTAAIVEAAKEVPQDPAFTTKAKSTTKAKLNVTSPFIDVSKENLYFDKINDAYTRNIVCGTGGNIFGPNDLLTMADALTILIRVIGLDSIAPNPIPITNFKDDEHIPEYAKQAVYVSEKIGFVYGDDRGYLNPVQNITKARAAAIINRFVDYMRQGIRKDYSDRIVNY